MRKWTGVPWPTAPVGSRYFRLLELNMGTSLFLLGMGGAKSPGLVKRGSRSSPLAGYLPSFEVRFFWGGTGEACQMFPA